MVGKDGKILPPVWLGDLPLEGDGGGVLLFTNVKLVKGDHMAARGASNKVIHRVHLAHPLPRITLPLPLLNTQHTTGMCLGAKMLGSTSCSPNPSRVAQPLRQ